MDITTILISILTWAMGTQFGPYVIAFIGVVGSLVTIASIIVPFTKTPEDDKLVEKAKALLGRFSVLEPKKK